MEVCRRTLDILKLLVNVNGNVRFSKDPRRRKGWLLKSKNPQEEWPVGGGTPAITN
jgi:hypothetical protein